MPTRLLCCIAHPDDECFAFGGALALAVRVGLDVHVICLTDGQAATNRGGFDSAEELGRVRREEFARSCRMLGITSWELMGLMDGKLAQLPFEDITRELLRRMRSFRPHIVLTFGLDGSLNVHADHSMVSCFTSLAFHWSGRAKVAPDCGEAWLPSRLYHQSTDFTLAEREPLLPAPWTVKLDISSVKEIKQAAFREHTTQLAVLAKVQPMWDVHGDNEFYVLAAASTPREAVVETGMFCQP